MALPNHIAVVGGGRMGAGIALSLAIGGSQVTVLERDAASVDAARARLDDIAQKAVAKDPAAPALDVLLGRLAVSEDYELLREANLVIEAVPEDFELKVNTLRAIEGASPRPPRSRRTRRRCRSRSSPQNSPTRPASSGCTSSTRFPPPP